MAGALITGVIVTKGGYPIDDVVDSLHGLDEILVWDNSTKARSRFVYGRYIGAARARNNTVLVVDDDAIVNVKALIDKWSEHMTPMVCNMPKDRRAEYDRRDPLISLVGWGCIFHKIVLGNFERYLAKHPADELFERECDRILTYLTPHTDVEVPFENLERAHGADRMGTEKRHGDDLTEICRRLKTLDRPNLSHAQPA